MLKDAADHFRHCAFAGAECEFEGCNVVMARAELGEHRSVCVHRTLICKWDGCVERFKAVEIEIHQRVCPKRTITCPNGGCSNSVHHDSLPQHRAICEFEMCACPFADVGCKARIRRRDIEKHEQDHSVQHNRLLLLAVREQRQAHASFKDQLLPDSERIVLRVKYDVLTGKEPFVPRFAHEPERLFSEDYVVRGYNTVAYLETNDLDYQDYYGLYLEMTGGPFPCKIEYTMEVEHHDGKAASAKKHTSTVTYDNQAWGPGNIISKAEMASPNNNPYVKDGYVTFKVTFKFV